MRNIFIFFLCFLPILAIAQFDNDKITIGAAQMDKYLPKLQNKKVGVVVNQTSMIGDLHLVDALLAKDVNLTKIFAPEHGFRGTADAGENVKNTTDIQTNLPILSLHGKTKKPTNAQLAGLDMVIFDIQDVGARFYTYISTMHYVMEACAENNIKMLILDRPNPNGHYVDGPVLEEAHKSFVGMHKIPVIHGMTVGELACMIDQEGWLKGGLSCDMEVIPCEGYTHKSFYQLPVRPSPNLPNMQSIYLYPHLCFFEGTTVSIGRGTNQQFQIVGHPDYELGSYKFTPKSGEGSKYPKHENKECHGQNLSDIPLVYMQKMEELNLSWLMLFANYFNSEANKGKQKKPFFNDNLFIDKLAGTDKLRKDILAGKSEYEIRQSWKEDVAIFKTKRAKYLLYPDFE